MKQLFLTMALAVLTAAPVAAFDIKAMTGVERTALHAELRAWLMENPEIIVEAINVLEQRQTNRQANDDEALIAANAGDIFDDGFSWVGGNPDGDVTVVEFLDYRCGFCRRAHPEVAELIATDGNIRLILKEYPILGAQSTEAARFAIAVKLNAGDAAYAAAHDGLMALRGSVGTTALRTLAGELGLDADAILAGMQEAEVGRIIDANRALAQRLQINGTPGFIFGDRMLRGYVPLEEMRGVVAELRTKG